LVPPFFILEVAIIRYSEAPKLFVIARMRVASALGVLSGLEPAQAEPVLAALPDDAARAVVTAARSAAQASPAAN